MAHVDILGHRNLDIVDEVAVEQRIEDGVGEAEIENVLGRLLAEVVIDPEHLMLREDRVHHGVERLGRGGVAPERLLDHHVTSAGCLSRSVGHSGAAEVGDGGTEKGRGDRQVG